MATVQTVTGPVDGDDLGYTLPHEHLFVDLSTWADEEGARDTMTRRKRASAEVSLETLWWQGTDRAFGSEARDNWRLDGSETALDEARRFARAGGGTIVDVTPMSPALGRDPERMRDVARETGLNVVAGTGHYVRHAHPESVGVQSVGDIAAEMVADLTDGIGTSGVRAGVIGEIGATHGFLEHESEVKCFRAAAEAQRETGVPITVHPPFFYQEGHDILDILADAGADLSNVILGHLDVSMRLQGSSEYYRSLADRGAYVQFDTFGRIGYHATFDESYPLDADRIAEIRSLFDDGYGDSVLVSQDICKKTHLTRYGGIGYDYILRDIFPRLERRGFTGDEIRRLLVDNPRAALER
jgi:phosphotriesterase-related protein